MAGSYYGKRGRRISVIFFFFRVPLRTWSRASAGRTNFGDCKDRIGVFVQFFRRIFEQILGPFHSLKYELILFSFNTSSPLLFIKTFNIEWQTNNISVYCELWIELNRKKIFRKFGHKKIKKKISQKINVKKKRLPDVYSKRECSRPISGNKSMRACATLFLWYFRTFDAPCKIRKEIYYENRNFCKQKII